MLISWQDVQWNDIDYMDQFKDFTLDSNKFATLPDLVKDLHAHNQRYVMILVRRVLYLTLVLCFVCCSLSVCDGYVPTRRTQESAALSLRAPTGRTMKD